MSIKKKAVDASPRELFLAAIKNKDKNQLHRLIEIYLKVRIPRKAISKDSTPPFDFIADFLFGSFKTALVLANRSGGKTMGFGILDTILAYISPHTEIATIGAIQFQAKKAYQYFSEYSSRLPFSDNIITMNMGETKCKNKSSVQIITGTMTGVNSPHPQIAFIDEIDLMLWQILQQAFSMTQSAHGVQSRLVLTSTRKFAAGVMNRMITESKERNMALYRWNIWDVVCPLPKNNPKLLAEIYRVFGDSLPENIKDADGYYEWEDLLEKYDLLDAETWEAEWLCQRPGLEGVVYGSSYNDENNLIEDLEPEDLTTGHVYLWEDFGYAESHPDVVLFVWIPPEYDRAIIFDELYMTKYSTEEIWDAINNKLAPYGHNLPNKQLQIHGTIKGWIGDPHGLSEINERMVLGAPMMGKNPDAKLYIIENGIPIVRKFLTSGRVMICERCSQLRTELLSYSYKKNLDGSFSRTTNKKLDHGPDALRYGLIVMSELLRRNWYTKSYEDPDKILKIVQEKHNKQEKLGKSTNKSITSGMMQMDF